jgi:D-amino-acid oxidase
MDRRLFLASSAASLPLAACTQAPVRSASALRRCLAPVKVSADRVIRTVAGLRPYREGGFVVRAESLGTKRLVHNYGHGGAGITLSWGSSRLAVELGLPGHSGPVAVLGAGVMGLTTARLVQEAGFPVTIYAAALPPDTTSNIAGGQWYPASLYREAAVTPEWRRQFEAAASYSWRRLQIMTGDDYGVRWLPTYNSVSGGPSPRPFAEFPPGQRLLARADVPFATTDEVERYDTIYVETGRFLRQLERDVRLGGGRIEVRRFADAGQIATLPESLVFNCTGLGARELFGDTEMRPVRGQLALLLPQPEIDYAYTLRAGYMFPRPDGIVLGGTFEHNQWDTTPQPAAIDRILRSHAALFEGWRCAA